MAIMELTGATQDQSDFRLHFLDMGDEKYGECILCTYQNTSILIDGGHIGDWQSRNGSRSIPDQLEVILGHPAPFAVDLLIVTHCHGDHIGCLPKLVEDGTLTAHCALVADETYGYGRTDDYVVPDAPSAQDRLIAALREEDHSDLPDDQLEQFLSDAANLEARYRTMLKTLKQQGTTIVRYGRNDHRRIEQQFREFGLTVLGPSKTQLERCAEAISHFSDVVDAYGLANDADSDSVIDAYRSIIRQADAMAGEDRPGKGAALNCQSITLKLSIGGANILLAGDMQFAKAEVSGVDRLMSQLRSAVKAAGPYHLIKLSHHSSYNGFDASLLAEWSSTTCYVHSGGINDPGHPDHGVLELLESQRNHLTWARTDRNGIITVSFTGTQPKFKKERGRLNDASPNGDIGGHTEPELPATHPAEPVRRSVTLTAGLSEVSASAKLTPDITRLTVTFDLERSRPTVEPPAELGDPQAHRIMTSASRSDQLAGGRSLPKLLFVTHSGRLANNIGATEAGSVIQLIRAGGQTIYDIRTPDNPFPEIRKLLSQDYKGIVIVGGYDVLPSQRIDVLPRTLRAQVGPITSDADNFIVWNDDGYGDRDGDGLPELPVSRIPDARSPQLVRAALFCAASASNPRPERFGIRNHARPFANKPFQILPGITPLLVSAPISPERLGSHPPDPYVYFMLHGSDIDATRFWGELPNGATIEAINLSNLPHATNGVIFTGCCWGALTVQVPANKFKSGFPLGVRTPGASVALSYLKAGAKAFVGCTGTHYSPTIPPFQYFGGPMHQAFWTRHIQGQAPAEALFGAKIEYLLGLPHGQQSATGQAIEFKIAKQYTCLGMGW